MQTGIAAFLTIIAEFWAIVFLLARIDKLKRQLPKRNKTGKFVKRA